MRAAGRQGGTSCGKDDFAHLRQLAPGNGGAGTADLANRLFMLAHLFQGNHAPHAGFRIGDQHGVGQHRQGFLPLAQPRKRKAAGQTEHRNQHQVRIVPPHAVEYAQGIAGMTAKIIMRFRARLPHQAESQRPARSLARLR